LRFRDEGGTEDSHTADHALQLSVYSGDTMEAMRESWTDARLDDFAVHTDRRFDAVDRRFDAVDQRFDAIDQRFDAVDQRLDAVDRRFDAVERRMENGFAEVNARFDALQRTMLQLGGGIAAALIAGFMGVIATQL
jgi:tetrahydromethanopterin S-methyltransferase subunit G